MYVTQTAGVAMVLGREEVDRIVFEILLDCWSVNPPLERNEVAQHVIDQISEDIRKEVYASLERMVGSGRVLMKAEPAGNRPYRYSLPPEAAGRH
jgi:hypothetical protein